MGRNFRRHNLRDIHLASLLAAITREPLAFIVQEGDFSGQVISINHRHGWVVPFVTVRVVRNGFSHFFLAMNWSLDSHASLASALPELGFARWKNCDEGAKRNGAIWIGCGQTPHFLPV